MSNDIRGGIPAGGDVHADLVPLRSKVYELEHRFQERQAHYSKLKPVYAGNVQKFQRHSRREVVERERLERELQVLQGYVETGRLQFGGLAVWGRQTVDPTGTNGFKNRLTFRHQWSPRGSPTGTNRHQQAPRSTERTAKLVFEIHGSAVDLILTAKPSNLPVPRLNERTLRRDSFTFWKVGRVLVKAVVVGVGPSCS